jgi:hypothetical protein
VIGEELWQELEAERPGRAGLVRRRLREDSERNIFVGVAHPGRRRVLILSVDPEVAASIVDPPATRALTTTVEEGDPPSSSDVRVTLTVPEMARVFSPFVDDVLDAIASAPSDADAVAALVTRFAHWRHLLAGVDAEGLGARAAQGLYGELWTLRHLVLASLGSSAERAWTGPERDDRDFQHGPLAIEVKTTIADNPPTVEIRSERQLQTDAFEDVYLVAIALDALPAGGGQTLNELTDELLGLVPDETTRLLLRDKLLEYGYADVHRRRYDTTRYTVRELSIFKVGEGFPRLTEHDMPNGVGRVRYTLALTACDPWRSSPDELTDALDRSRDRR